MTWARSWSGVRLSNVATTACPREILSDTTSVNDGSATGWPLTRKSTVHATVVPGTADGAMSAVSVNETVPPLVTGFEAASKPILKPGSHDTTSGVTTTA